MNESYILNHTLDSTENIAENLTKDDKTSITDGLSKLLGLFKDGDKDSVGPKNVNNAKEIDSRSFMDEEQLSEEESESKEDTGNHSKELNNPSR